MMNSGEIWRCRKVNFYLQKNLLIMRCFCFFHSVMYNNCSHVVHQTNKLQEQGVQDLLNRSKIKFEPYGELVSQAFPQLIENLINNQDSHSQTEIDTTLEAKCFNENYSEDRETNKTSAIWFMPGLKII